jgi:hypothetical protein
VDLISEAKEIFRQQGWRVHDAAAFAAVGLDFDLAAESKASLVFLKVTSGAQLGEVANRLAGEIAAITLSRDSGAKAWEAYLILLVSEAYEEHLADVQALQYDFSFCRRVVLDLSEILDADDPEERLLANLAFLFPLGMPTAPSITDIRDQLATHLAGRGILPELAQDLVTHFDDAKCGCIRRIAQHSEDDTT